MRQNELISKTPMGQPATQPATRLNKIQPNINVESTSKIYIVGSGRRAREVFESLENSSIERIMLPNIRGIAKKIDPSAQGVVFVDPMVGLDDGIKALKSSPHLSRMPIFVAAIDTIPGAVAREMYSKGVESVVAFPKEKHLFADILKEMQKRGPRVLAITEQDRRISKAVWARAKTVLDSMNKIKVWCHGGFVYFVGRVPSISKKESLEQIIESAPGVEELVDVGMEVPPTRKVDMELESKIIETIEDTPEVTPETLLHTVTQGNVVIAGNVKSKGAMNRLNKNIQQLFGVRTVSNLSTVSPKRSKIDKISANKIKDSIDQFFTHSNIDVTVMRNVAVLKGVVSDVSKKRMAEELTLQHNPITKIINKLEVRSV